MGMSRTALVARDGVALGTADGTEQVALADYMGVSVTVAQSWTRSSGDDRPIAAMVILDHGDPEKCVPLFVAHDTAEVTARWQAWARALALPLLVRGLDGDRRAPLDMLGALTVRRPAPRRAGICLSRRHSPATMRRAPARPVRGGLRAGRELASWE